MASNAQHGDDSDDRKRKQLAAVSANPRTASKCYHWRQAGVSARRFTPTSIESALVRLSASAVAIRAYLAKLNEFDQWLNDKLKAIDLRLGRIRRVEKIVSGMESVPGRALSADCPPHLLLVACYADLARQALHGPIEVHASADCGWPLISGDQSDGDGDGEGDVKAPLTLDSLFRPLHEAAITAGLSVLTATDQRVQTDGCSGGSSLAGDNLTTEQTREYKSFMSILPPVKKPGRRLGDLLSLLTRSLYQITKDALMMGDDLNDDERHHQASNSGLDSEQLRSFNDFVSHSQPIVRTFLLPEGRKLVLSLDQRHSGANAQNVSSVAVHEAPSVLLERLIDVVCADVTRRFRTEEYSAHVILEQLQRRLATAPREAGSAVELARELELHCRLLEMSSRYDNMEALTQSLVTCATERVRTQTDFIVDKWKSKCPCRSVYHIVVV